MTTIEETPTNLHASRGVVTRDTPVARTHPPTTMATTTIVAREVNMSSLTYNVPY